MIAKILSLLAALGLISSVSTKVNPAPKTKTLHASALEVLQTSMEASTDGKPYPPVPGGGV